MNELNSLSITTENLFNGHKTHMWRTPRWRKFISCFSKKFIWKRAINWNCPK